MVDIMDIQTKYICRLRFQNLIYSSDAQAFEDLFVKVMRAKNSNFYPVKPQGQHGDMKNDGYIDEEGIYFQVHGPESIEKSIAKARKKIETDLTGLLKQWDGVDKFYYVINDKYKGVGAKIHNDLQELKKLLKDLGDDSNIEAGLIVPRDLEDWVLELDQETIYSIIGFLPEDIKDIDLDYAALNDVIDYILKLPVNIRDEKLVVPSFDEKIVYNFGDETGQIVGSEAANKIKMYSSNYGDIEIFFLGQSDFIRFQLQKRFSELYLKSKDVIPEENKNFSDLRYIYMLDTCLPEENRTMVNIIAIQSLFAYFFETCDIFEEPK